MSKRAVLIWRELAKHVQANVSGTVTRSKDFMVIGMQCNMGLLQPQCQVGASGHRRVSRDFRRTLSCRYASACTETDRGFTCAEHGVLCVYLRAANSFFASSFPWSGDVTAMANTSTFRAFFLSATWHSRPRLRVGGSAAPEGLGVQRLAHI